MSPSTDISTHFFREPGALALVCRRLVLPRHVAGGPPLSVWSAGCATGDEAYSLAMSVLDAGAVVEVLATDIHSLALRTAERGEYGPRHLHEVDELTRARWFAPLPDGRYRVREEVRDLVSFANHDLVLDPAPALRFDVVLCRNVLIYLERADAVRAVASMAATLKPGGWLVLGASERLPAAVRLGSREAGELVLEEEEGVAFYRRGVGPAVVGVPPLLPRVHGTGPVAPIAPIAPVGSPLAVDDLVQFLRRAGDALLDAGRCAEARQHYSDAVARAPRAPDLHLRLALTWIHDDSPALELDLIAARARAALRQCLLLAPELWTAWLLYAEVLIPDDSAAAVAALERARHLLSTRAPAESPAELAGFLADAQAARDAVERWLRILRREGSP